MHEVRVADIRSKEHAAALRASNRQPRGVAPWQSPNAAEITRPNAPSVTFLAGRTPARNGCVAIAPLYASAARTHKPLCGERHRLRACASGFRADRHVMQVVVVIDSVAEAFGAQAVRRSV